MDLDSRVLSIDVEAAHQRLHGVVLKTPLQYHKKLSEKFKAQIWIKREDLQVVRSYKIRGAYNLISSLDEHQKLRGVTCASAGNHAQGVAWSCRALGIRGVIYMPAITPKQKINQVRMFGGDQIEIVLVGDTFDECQKHARAYSLEHQMIFIPPFDHERIIEGQGTVGKEILEDIDTVDFLFLPVGGGGLSSGIGHHFKTLSPSTRIIGVEPQGAPSMTEALKVGHPVELEKIQSFVDGASVKRVGDLNFQICKDAIAEMVLVPEGKVSGTILQLYNECL